MEKYIWKMDLHRSSNRFLCSLKILKILPRACMRYSKDVYDEEDEEEVNKPKRKVTSISKSFPKDSDSPILLEVKDASTVIKNLNWQFKKLYGAIQSPKSNSTYQKPFNGDNRIIQNRTVFPILEPKSESKPSHYEDSDTKNESKEINYWKSLLKFPLLNQKSTTLQSDIGINEINALRKILEEKSKSYVPSVSRILEKTMPQQQAESLRRWKKNMIQQLGEEGFQKYQSELLSNGHTLHTCINNYLSSVPRSELEIEKTIAGHWESLKTIFPSVNDIKLLEERLTHPFLQYKGIVDCFARYQGKLVVIDWKTSKKKKLTLSSTFDNPLQIAAYVGALNFDPKYQYLANKGLIVVAYEDGSKASAHFINESIMQHYWKEWLARVKLYWELTEQEES